MRIQKKTSMRRRLAAVLATGTALVLAGVGLTALPAAAASVDTSAYYVLVNRQSGKALEVRDFSTADGGIMQQWTRNDGNWQQFRFLDSGSGWYRLQNRHSGKVLDVWGWSTADGGEIRQYTDANAANQKFKLVDSEGGRVRLVNQNSGKAVTLTDRSTADGATITQLTRKGNQYNQQWVVEGGQRLEPTSTRRHPRPPAWSAGRRRTAAPTAAARGPSTTVTSASALSGGLGGSAAVVRVSGTITCSGMLTVGVQQDGRGASGAKIVGCGLNLKASRTSSSGT